MSTSWLSKSKKQKSFVGPIAFVNFTNINEYVANRLTFKFRDVDTSGHLIRDKEAEKQHDFNLELTLELAARKPLLSGFKIHVTDGVKPPPAEMKDIITSAGAKVRTTHPIMVVASEFTLRYAFSTCRSCRLT